MLKLAEEGNYKSPHLDNLDRKYPGDNNNDTEMPDVKCITPINELFISKCTTSTQLRSGIQSTCSRFKSIKFDNGQEE